MMNILKVKGNTFCIDTGNAYIPFYKINNKEIIMLDTGLKQDRNGIDEILENNEFKVVGIINSHAHIDHIGNNAYLKGKYNSIIAMSTKEAYLCSSIRNLKGYYGNQSLSEANKYLKHMICDTDILISDNDDKVAIEGIEFKIIHLYGHSSAHICIITPDEVAYLGDSLISYEVMNKAKIPYSQILSEDLRNKGKLYSLRSSKYIVAHKGIYDDINNLVYDNIKFYKDRAEKVYSAIDDSECMTVDEIIRSIIKKLNIYVKDTFKYNVVSRMVMPYIDYLDEIGCIESNNVDGIPKYCKKSIVK